MIEILLALIGMWWHPHKDIIDISDGESVIFECEKCGKEWSWYRYTNDDWNL